MFRKFFTKQRVLILFILWILMNLAFHFGPWSISALKEVSGGSGIPDVMLNYDLNTLNKLFNDYGPQGIAIYKKIQILDFIYPLIYTTLMLGILARLRKPKFFNKPYFLPFAILIMDYSENFLLRYLINHYPFLTPDFRKYAELASIATSLKWAFIAVVLLEITAFFIYGLLHKSKRHKSRH